MMFTFYFMSIKFILYKCAKASNNFHSSASVCLKKESRTDIAIASITVSKLNNSHSNIGRWNSKYLPRQLHVVFTFESLFYKVNFKKPHSEFETHANIVQKGV